MPPSATSAQPADTATPVPGLRFAPLTVERLDAVLAVEQRAYSHPWSRRNFLDTLQAGHHAVCLLADEVLLGYFVAMPGFQEVHLLNLTVAPDHQRQGWARLMLRSLSAWARAQSAEWLWLEVRLSNTRAQQVYLRHGFNRVGLRKAYYPDSHGQREDAVVMSLRLPTPC